MTKDRQVLILLRDTHMFGDNYNMFHQLVQYFRFKLLVT